MGGQSWINECEVIIHWWKSGVLWRMRLLEQRTQRRRTQPQGCCRRNRVSVWWTSRSLGQWRLLLRGRDQPDVNSFLGINVSSANCITHGLDLTISKTLLSMFNMLPFQTSSQRCKPSKCTLEETLGFKIKGGESAWD